MVRNLKIAAHVLLAGALLLAFQQCGKAKSFLVDSPGTSSLPSNGGNGGGYGGMTPNDGGDYDNISGPSGDPGQQYLHSYYLFRMQNRCANGAYVDGIVTINSQGPTVYQPDLCTPPVRILSPMFGAQFNENILLHQNRIYLYKKTFPASAAAAEFAHLYCKSSRFTAGIEEGFDIFVYTLNGVTQALVKEGVATSPATGEVRNFGPQPVSMTVDTQPRTVNSPGILLTVGNVVNRRATAQATLNLQGRPPISFTADCYVTD